MYVQIRSDLVSEEDGLRLESNAHVIEPSRHVTGEKERTTQVLANYTASGMHTEQGGNSPKSVSKPIAEPTPQRSGLSRERRPSRRSKKLAEHAVPAEIVLRDSTPDDIGKLSNRPSEVAQPSVFKTLDEYISALLKSDDASPTEDVRFAMRGLRQNVTAGGKDVSIYSLSYALAKVYEIMKERRENEQTQDRAIHLIGKLSREREWVSGVVAKTGGIEVIVDAMSCHSSSSVIQQRAVTTLLHLTTTETARTAMVNAKGAESVCWAMKGFVEVKSIQAQGSTALCNMAFGSASSKKRIGKIGGIDAVVKAMDSHASDSDLQARCCLALRNLTCGSRVNQWISGRACAIEAVLTALQNFPDDIGLQYQGCVALENLCRDEPDNRERATDGGVIEATLKIVQTHLSHAGIVEHSLALLSSLIVGNERSQFRIGQLGGVRDVVACLRQHITASSVLANGCDVLRHLMFVRENRLAILACGGLEILVRVMREGASSQTVAEAAIYALGNSAYDLPESKSAIGRYGGMSALVDLMKNHLDSASIQSQGCRALRNLADSDDLNSRLLAESGAIDACIFACSGYPEYANVQEHAIAMLFNLACSDENVRRMQGLDAERVAIQACQQHADNEAVVNQGTALLERLRKPSQPPLSQHQSFGLKSNKSSTYLGALARRGSYLVSEKRSKPRLFQSSRLI
jgi:hypothetical protein